MKMLGVFAVIVTLFAAPPAAAAEYEVIEPTEAVTQTAEPVRITLHDEALVEGETIRLGDLASMSGEGAETLASLEINPAPVPGNSRNLTSSLIEARIRNAGLEPQSFEVRGPRVIKTTRMHQVITHARIEDALESHILYEMPWDPGLAVVELMVPKQEITLPPGVVEISWQTNPRYDYLGLGAFKADILVDGERQRSVLCRANIDAFGELPVAVDQITRGQVLGPNDIRMERHSLNDVPPGAYRDAEEVAGLVARTTILPGQVITQRRVEPRTLVRRRQLVTVESRTGALSVTTQARAMSDGKAGDVIELMNTESQQVFTGIVRPDGRVMVQR